MNTCVSNKNQNHYGTKTLNESISYQISHVFCARYRFANDSYIPSEISYEPEENILKQSNHCRKSNAILISRKTFQKYKPW